MTRNQDCGCAEHASHDGCLPGCFDYACRRWNESPAGRPLQTVPYTTAANVVADAAELMAQHPIAYTNVTADDWVATDGPDTCADCLGHPRLCRRHAGHGDQDAAALMDLVDQRAADDNETASDGGEL